MKWLFPAVFLLFAPFALADLPSDLDQAGISAVFPNQPAYANASQPFNLRFNYQPDAVAYPTSTEQVSEIVKLGRQFGLRVSARSGGHSYIANALGNGTIVVDLSKLKKISVNKVKGTATIETGNRLGDVAAALSKEDVALPHGTCPYVGIGGHAGHGGFGFTSRQWGLTLDNIQSATVVLANGTITDTSKTRNSDLFWAIRGSSSSFGIVTEIEVKTFPAPAYAIIFQYNWQLNYTLAGKAWQLFQDFVKTDIPAEIGLEIILTPGAIPGNVSLGLTGSWYGAKGGENTTVEPFLKAMPPLNTVSFSGNGTWIDNLLIFAGGSLDTSSPEGPDTFYAKSLMIPESAPLTLEASTAFMKYVANEGFNSTTSWFLISELFGGSNSAINAVPLNDTSFGRRDALINIQLYTSEKNHSPPFPSAGFDLLDGMVNSITNNMPKNWAYGAYINYIDDRLPDWQRRYYGSHYPRLRALKQKFDPHNVFRFPESIQE